MLRIVLQKVCRSGLEDALDVPAPLLRLLEVHRRTESSTTTHSGEVKSSSGGKRLTAYNLFFKDRLPKLKSEHGGLKHPEIMKLVGQKYKELSPADKQILQNRAAAHNSHMEPAPKRASTRQAKKLSAYSYFLKDRLKATVAANPSRPFKDIMPEVAQEWSSLTNEEKAAFKPKE